MKHSLIGNWLILLLLQLALANATLAAEQVIGKPHYHHGMEIGAVYLQPVLMAPAGETDAALTDIHLELDIAATENNRHGFSPGAWIPYLAVEYTLTKHGSDWQHTGTFMPMVANDGTHYGANVKLAGSGRYHLKYVISPPTQQGFMRHVDQETGVAAWWEPIEVEWNFNFFGVGKKGGY